MHSHLAGSGIVLLFLVACAPPHSTSSTSTVQCTDATAAHHAYVVVQHLSGAWFARCVGFANATIDGQTVMDRSAIEYKAEPVASGKVVCQVDFEPKQYSQCFPQNQPYWAVFVESGAKWSNASGVFPDVSLRDGEALGWHYVSAADPAPAPPPLPN